MWIVKKNRSGQLIGVAWWMKMVEVDEDGWGQSKKAENRIRGGSSIGSHRGGEEKERRIETREGGGGQEVG